MTDTSSPLLSRSSLRPNERLTWYGYGLAAAEKVLTEPHFVAGKGSIGGFVLVAGIGDCDRG
jgi:hypothetical protein